ncbi:MAG: UPF0182 family protein [Fimbriimonas sp.]|nr:UPF0182 family protein [Fimbriimonas sp.]
MQHDPGSYRIQIDPLQMKRALRRGRAIAIIALIVVAFLTCVVPYTDFLWYAHDARHPDVFEVSYGTRATLLLVAFVSTWAVLYWNVRKALKVSLIFLNAPENRGQAMLSNAIDWVTRQGSVIVMVGAPILAFLLATGLSGEWNTLLMAQHAQNFHVKDPILGIDLGFYVFSLPWYRALSNYVFGLLFVTTLISVGVYTGIQAMALIAKIEISRPHIRSHVSALIGLSLLAYAFQTWLKTYEYGLVDSGQFTGAGFSAMYQLTLMRFFVWCVVVVGLGTMLLQKAGKPYSFAIGGGTGLFAYYVLLILGVPFIVQRFSVEPDRIHKEAPFAQKAMDMTRFAYGLDKIAYKDWDVHDSPTLAEVKASTATLDNMRLWDPDILRQALEAVQSVKPYYAFNDVDIDRYRVGGKQTMLMLSPRDLRLGGLDPAAQNWANQRLRYTHGYGLTVSQVDQVSADGQPVFLASNMPLQTSPELKVEEPRIYFSDDRSGAGDPTDQYALVNTGETEFDFPPAHGNKWTGDRGVPISGPLARLAFSIALGDGNLLISQNITSDTRLLMRRNVVERASKIYPFLRFDDDPYMVINKGRLTWILDGYTSTAMIPYSARVDSPNGAVNYIRNSVKLTVDAYTGEVDAYAIQPDEPILKAYREIYAGLVHDMKDLPAGLEQHFRYPEDLFQLQSMQLMEYHVTDPTVFLTNADAWNIARERGLMGEKEAIRPYYVQLQLEGEATPQFQLILPFTPNQKPNMSGWLSAACDVGSYGKLTLYRFKGPLPKGPELMEADFSSTPEISYINRQYQNDQSKIIVGNLLVIPIGQSVMYSESLFLQSRTSGIQAVPRLFRVILATQNKVVVGETYADALRQLFQTQESPVATSAPPAQPGSTTKLPASTIATAKSALEQFDRANEALKSGDFAKYGELQSQLRKTLTQLAAKP